MPRESGAPGTMGTAEVLTNAGGDGLKSYYRAKIEEYEVAVRDKTQNLRRLEAQRNELNHKGASVPPSDPDPVRSGASEPRASRPFAGPVGRCAPVQRVREPHAEDVRAVDGPAPSPIAPRPA